MTRTDDYRRALRQTKEWEPFLRAESRLPGPRANLELAHAAALEGSEEQLARLRESPQEHWIADGDAGTRRIMRENLRKARLARLDGEWVQRQLARI